MTHVGLPAAGHLVIPRVAIPYRKVDTTKPSLVKMAAGVLPCKNSHVNYDTL